MLAVSRRLAPRLVRGVVASSLVLGLGACGSDKVSIGAPEDLSGAQVDACRALVAALPDTLAQQLRRPVDPDDALGAAWGDPAYVLTCGATVPASFGDTSTCDIANGVAWYADPDQAAQPAADITVTTIGREPNVAIAIPGEHRPEGVAAALTQLARPIKKALTKGSDCG